MKNRGWEIPLLNSVKHVWSFLRDARNPNGYSIISKNQRSTDKISPTQNGINIHYLNIIQK